MVQAVVNERMSEERTRRRPGRPSIGCWSRPVPEGDVDDPQTWPRYRLIWPHLSPSEAMWSSRGAGPPTADRAGALSPPARRPGAWPQASGGDPGAPGRAMLASKLEPEMAESLQRQLFRLQFNLANILRDLALIPGVPGGG